MRICVASDHAGFTLKNELAQALRAAGHDVTDLGAHSAESVDYPDFGRDVARSVADSGGLGVLVCGTGIGMSMAANKVKGVRAALCTSEFEARMARSHNDANVLCLGQRVVGPGMARAIVEAFLATPFEGGRHAARVEKLNALDGDR
jgi:ribose 5-phosphate isomerase B